MGAGAEGDDARGEGAGVAEGERWDELLGGPVRSLVFSPQGWVEPTLRVAVFPGLGLPNYLLPLARRLAELGCEVVVFDALAFRGRRARVLPTIGGLATAGAEWLAAVVARDPDTPVVVLGHSTGAQVALESVLHSPPRTGVLALVMAGPTFTPAQRRLHRLAGAALTAWRKDPPTELVVLRNLARVRTDVVRIVLSGLRHRPEVRVAALTVPLTVTAGEADSFAPAPWLHELADGAGGPSRVVVLPGSHNNVFPHTHEVAALVVTAGDVGLNPGGRTPSGTRSRD